VADYFARVELHGAQWPDDYNKLHEALKQHGFLNCILADNERWRLPTASYYSTDRIDDVAAVAKVVKHCADSTGYENEVFVIKNAGWNAFPSSKCE
jgi:hypothetical protein